MKKPVDLTVKTPRTLCLRQTKFSLETGQQVSGKLSFNPSDGPLGESAYEYPEFLECTFDFQLNGCDYTNTSVLTKWHLWAPDGTTVRKSNGSFQSECGTLASVIDDRRDWYYILPNGEEHHNRLKYTSCYFEIMVQRTSLLVKCRYYDQNSDICDFVTILYERDLDELLLLRDHKYDYDAEGNIEDVEWNQGDGITINRAEQD